MGRQFIIFVLLAIYVSVIGIWTDYHAHHFSYYIHQKGDEVSYYVWILFLTSVLFQVLICIIGKKIDWKPALLSTVVNVIVSFIIGACILMMSTVSGIPKHLIFIYGICYITIFVVITALQIRRIE